MKKANLTDRTITGYTEPIELENCHRITFINPKITGGPNNISLLGCTDITIQGGSLENPDGPNDPAGKHVLADQCSGIKIISVRCSCVKPSGDGINFYKSHDCIIYGTGIWGPKDNKNDRAAAICIDTGTYNIKILKCDIRKFGKVGISIAAGYNIEIAGCKILLATSSGIQIDGSGYKETIKDVSIHGNTITTDGCKPIWYNPKFTENLVVNRKTIKDIGDLDGAEA